MAVSAEPRDTGGAANPRRRRALVFAGERSPLVEGQLSRAGIGCEVARSAGEAFRRAARGRFEMIVCLAERDGESEIADGLQALQPQAQAIVGTSADLVSRLTDHLRVTHRAREIEPWEWPASEDW